VLYIYREAYLGLK